MPRSHKQQYDEAKSCLDFALERLDYVFDVFDQVAVSFSGGKDSTVCLNLALQVATEKKMLPLKVFTFDEECIPPETVEYIERVRQRDDIAFDWYCCPIEHRNACSRSQPYWYPWAPEDEAKWVRPLPSRAITDFPGFRRIGLRELSPALFPASGGTFANIMGIRTQESIVRHRSIVVKKGFNAFLSKPPDLGHQTNVMPIYDWKTDDVWLAPETFGWDYNRAYDTMNAYGMTRSQQRCCPPFGEQPIRGLYRFKSCWPELWAKMIDRVHGAATAARYSNTELYGISVKDSDLPDGKTWRILTMETLANLPEPSKSEAAEGIQSCISIHDNRTNDPLPDSAPHPLTGFSWKVLYRGAKAGGNKMGRQSQKMNGLAREFRRSAGI